MSELNVIYAEIPGWARAFQIGGDEGEGGEYETVIKVNGGETIVAAVAFEQNINELPDQTISAKLIRIDGEEVIYQFSPQHPFFILEAEENEEFRIRVSSQGAPTFSFNVAAFGSNPTRIQTSWRCRACKIIAAALAAAIAVGIIMGTPGAVALIAAVAKFLYVAKEIAHSIVEALLHKTIEEILEFLCGYLGFCPPSDENENRINIGRSRGEAAPPLIPVPA